MKIEEIKRQIEQEQEWLDKQDPLLTDEVIESKKNIERMKKMLKEMGAEQ